MSQSFITIQGQTYDPALLTLPASRQHRNFWTVNGTVVEVDMEAALADARSRATIRREALALVAAEEGWITEGEAVLWASGQQIPGWIEAIIDNDIPAEHRLRVKLEVLTLREFPRLGILMPYLQAAPQTGGAATDEKMDEIFGVIV